MNLKAIGSSQRSTDPRIEVLRYEHSLGERSGVASPQPGGG